MRDSDSITVTDENVDANVVIYECNTSPAVWSEELKIFPPEKILNDPDATIVIGCFYVKEVVENLRRIGCKNKILVHPHFGGRFPCEENMPANIDDMMKIVNQWMRANEKEFIALYNMDDEETRRVVNETIIERSMNRLEFIPLDRMIDFELLTYFGDKSLSPSGDITLVDGGAFTGDSIEDIYKIYGNRLKKIYAFEPDAINRKSMKVNLKRLELDNITQYVDCGMYHEDTELRFNSDGISSGFTATGTNVVPVKKIDTVVKDVVGTLCIKMDIEGAEVSALRGARETILKYRPYMAICVYHKLGDFVDVPKCIKEICPDYDFYLRAGFHFECWAVPKK